MAHKTLEPAPTAAATAQGATVQPATAQPATLEVLKVVASTIVKDSQANPEQYLEETVVPHGGE